MSQRARFVSVLFGVLLLAGPPSALGLGAGSFQSAELALHFDFTQSGGIRLTSPDGTPVGATPIPPGLYQIVVYNEFRDDDGWVHMLRVVGPGVDLLTDMNQGEQELASWRFTLQPNSTYTWEDEYRPSALRGVFRTSAAGTASTGGTSSGATSPGGSSGGGSGSTGNTDAVGSAILPVRGTLNAGVTTSGKLKLTFKGKRVSSLKSGRYKITVLDETARSGFKLQRIQKPAITLSSLPFVGRNSKTVSLSPGQWLFYSSAGDKNYFVVTR